MEKRIKRKENKKNENKLQIIKKEIQLSSLKSNKSMIYNKIIASQKKQ